jgi:ferredoxin
VEDQATIDAVSALMLGLPPEQAAEIRAMSWKISKEEGKRWPLSLAEAYKRKDDKMKCVVCGGYEAELCPNCAQQFLRVQRVVSQLLAALEAACALLDNLQAFGKQPDPSRLAVACMNARAAIAKAKEG